MAKGKLHTGIVLDNDALKIAVLRVSGKNVELVKLDKFTLIKPLEKGASPEQQEDVFSDLDSELADDSVFDLDIDDALESQEEEVNTITDTDLEEDILGDLGDDFDLELDELDQQDEELVDVDMVDETHVPVNNEMLLYNILSSIDPKRINLALNVPAGITIFQILKDTDFSEVKKKDLQIIIDDRIESLYGSPKGKDFYSYNVRENGSLLLASIDEEPQMLQLTNRTLSLYNGKLTIDEITSDEVILLGLIRANYHLDDGGITCLIQFSEQSCRVLFLKDDRLWLVSPVITEGTRSRKILNTVFSKILFQLDTGEVPNLDRLIICNNSLGETATSFFQERFPDVDVSDFSFTEDFLDPGEYTEESMASFTTAIGTAWSSTNQKKNFLPDISFLPKYVVDRQKIFKLQWHGFMLLVMIMASFPIMNELWLNSRRQITEMENEISIIDAQIESFSETVNNYNRISNELSQIQDKLSLMNTLAENSLTWTTNLDLVNSGIDNVNSVWLTTLSNGVDENTLEIQGVARYRSRIPMIAELFSDATLLSVSRSEIREEEVYNFSYQIDKIFDNTSVYTPDNLQGLEDLIGN